MKLTEKQSQALAKLLESGEFKQIGPISVNYGIASFRVYSSRDESKKVYPMTMEQDGIYKSSQPFYTVADYLKHNPEYSI